MVSWQEQQVEGIRLASKAEDSALGEKRQTPPTPRAQNSVGVK